MTLIAFHAQADRADIINDTWSYDPSGRHFGRSFKVMTLPHLDRAVITQGAVMFGELWDVHARVLAGQVADFDEFNQHAPDQLRETWCELNFDRELANIQHQADWQYADSTAFHVGWSPSASRFMAVGFSSESDFEPVEIDGLHVMPSPLSVRPSDLELGRLARHWAKAPSPDDEAALDQLRALPLPPAPQTDQAWVQLALAARQDRTMAPVQSGHKTFVGGDLFHTVLTPGAVIQAKVHIFNDAGNELAQAMAGTLHPLGQVGPCPCGSGERYLDCHLRSALAEPCTCGSGALLADCCSVLADAQTPAGVDA